MKYQSALTVDSLTKIYTNGTEALKGISFTVEKGDFFGLLGPNGAGKTTTIEIITSITKKTSGSVEINGINIDQNFSLAKHKLGIVPQELNFNIFETPLQIMLKQAGYYGISRKMATPRAEYLLKKLDLWDKKNQQSRNLSGGMKRRLMIARGLIHNPELLILDEPTAGVDVELRRDMLDFVRDINKQGTTIILTTHYLEEAESLCNNIAIMNKGKIVKKATVKELIHTLDMETFILNLQDNITSPPSLPGYEITMLDDNTLSVDISKQQSLNNLFEILSKQNIQVVSLKNKANRLEEYFLKSTRDNINI